MKLNKKQKRTATIASMAALLAVVLGMGGQTFAKYITTHNVPAKTATVAQWGVVITSDATLLFGKDYTNGQVITGTKGAGVSTTGSSDVVAPGTEGKMTLTISGKPEVSSEIKFNVTGDPIGLYDASGITYEPIRWTVTKGSTEAKTNATFSELKAYFESEEKEYGPDATLDATYTIKWRWAFDENEAGHIDNDNDTLLGNIVAGKADQGSHKTSFEFNMSVEIAQTKK